MALFEKQDFAPMVLSRRWITMQFRPNMLINCQDHVIAIMESGLLFREDSVEIDQEVPYWTEEDYSGAWLTTGEKVVSAVAVSAMFALCPLRSFQRGAMLRLSGYVAAPLALRAVHRWRAGGSVRALIEVMCEYLGVARRAAACCREYAALHAKLASVFTVVESIQTLLIRQQADMVNLLSRASSAVLGNSPWLRGDVAWEAVCRPGDSLMKIHHTFLVVQSLLLKHLAMAHYIPLSGKKVFKNHNERIYWLHNVVCKYLIAEYRENYEALERMYRLLKNCGTKHDSQNEVKKPGSAIKDNWLYSEVHTDIAKACLELKIAHSKSVSIDMFLDSCGLNRTEIDLDVLNKDIDELIDNITKCLSTAQTSQIRLKKLQGKMKGVEPNAVEEVIDEINVVKVEQHFVPAPRDEVFYFVKTDDDEAAPRAADLTTAPGIKEKENSKVVLSELRRKLGKREDLMRERERQALIKTMPQYRFNVPEFPRQIRLEEFVEKKGYIKKIRKEEPKKRLFKHYRIGREKVREIFKKGDKYMLSIAKFAHFTEVKDELYEANGKLNASTELLTILRNRDTIIVIKWRRSDVGYSIGLSDVEEESVVSDSEGSTVMSNDRNKHGVDNFRYTKNDLELTPSSSEEELGIALLNDAKMQREGRKYFPRGSGDEDESLRPIEYRFGTGMAMASVLQGHSSGVLPTMAPEEVFIGDGEVSDDSGHSGDE